jgi:hypothetical protein
MRSLDINEPAPPLGELARSLGDEALVLTDGGRPLAVLLPVEGADMETIALSLSARFQAILERSARRQHEEGGIPAEEMRTRVGAEARPRRQGRRAGT